MNVRLGERNTTFVSSIDGNWSNAWLVMEVVDTTAIGIRNAGLARELERSDKNPSLNPRIHRRKRHGSPREIEVGEMKNTPFISCGEQNPVVSTQALLAYIEIAWFAS